jgi:hypothetical protein
LYGRATYLIQSHVNTVLSSNKWKTANGERTPVGYAEVNAVMFDAIDWRREMAEHNPAKVTAPEVELSVVRILESLRQHRNVSWEETNALLQRHKLDDYLAGFDG